MLKTFIVDDEPLALERLRRMLQATGRVEIAGACSDPVEAVNRFAGRGRNCCSSTSTCRS